MSTCKFCGQTLQSGATFCSVCGESQLQPDSDIFVTTDDRPTVEVAHSDLATMISKSRQQEIVTTQSNSQLVDEGTVPLPAVQPPNEDEGDEDDEKRKRRLALLGVAALGEALSGGGDATVPIVPGPLQINQAPVIQGMPQLGNPGGMFSYRPGTGSGGPSWHGAPPSIGGTTRPATPKRPTTPTTSGCTTVAIIILIPLLLLTSFLTAGYTIFGPTISLNSASSVAAGDSFILHGNGFLANTTIALTLDSGTPLSIAYHQVPMQPQSAAIASMLARQVFLGHNTLSADGSGKFSISIQVEQNWSTGSHAIHATETLSFRSATTNITVTRGGQSATATPATDTTTPGATDTVTPTDTPVVTPAPGQTGLIAITPGDVTFGPVPAGSSQPISTLVTLSTAGSASIPWTASWDQNNAPWLQLNLTSGQIQEPNTQQIKIGAIATTLTPNTYKATVTFSSPQSTTSLTLNVSLIVQNPCLTASPTALTFTGVANTSNPAAQTLTLHNCGIDSSWSSSVSTASGGNWLSINPTGNNIANNTDQPITVKATNVAYKLAPGTYQGTITFTSGPRLISVSVTLIVQAPPVPAILTVTPTSFPNTAGCSRGTTANFYTCTVSLTSNRDASSNLNWTASSNVAGPTFSQSKGTLTPGGTTRVTIVIPFTLCNMGMVTFTFQGPDNAQQVTWNCILIS